MKAISAKVVKSLSQKSRLVCADNSGAKELEIITAIGFKTRKKMNPKAGLGDLVVVVVKEGKPEIRKKVERAVIIRTKKAFRRENGLRVKFEDNAAVLIDEKGLPKGTELKGPVPREIGERWPKIVGIASQVV